MTRFFLLIASFLLLASCRSTKNIQTAISKKDTAVVMAINSGAEDSVQVVQELLAKIDSGRLQFTTFTAKLAIDYQGSDGKTYNVNSNIRMYKDSAIWISANAILGIEAMRVLITKDSVKLLDKLNKTYTARSVDYLQEVTSLPLDLFTLQDLILGNAVFVGPRVLSVTTQGSTISLLSTGGWFKNLLTLDASGFLLLHSKLDDVNPMRNRTATLAYAGYENKRGFVFATKRNITVSEKTRLDIKLDFKQYAVNEEVSFPFSIPRNYDRN